MCGAGQNRVARPFQRLVGQDGEEAPPWRRMRSDTLFLTYRAQRVKNEAARRFRARRVKNEAARPLRASRDRHLPKTIKMHYDVHPFSGLLFQEGGGGTSGADEIGHLNFSKPCPQEIGHLIFFKPCPKEIGHPILAGPCPNGVGPPYFEPAMPGWARMGGGRTFSTGT